MKKLLTLILVLAMVPVIALSDYTPALGMTIEELASKYNAIQAPLGAPYRILKEPDYWSSGDNNLHTAWFYPMDNNDSVCVYILSYDQDNVSTMQSGVDSIQIRLYDTEEFPALISISNRFATIFAPEFLGAAVAQSTITLVISNYFENNLKEKNRLSYRNIDGLNQYRLSFWYNNGYCFAIEPEVIK